ncbi:hypothetical protein ASPZODRAFT_27031 [Penicilliopsis zonata CBS 506.65]|uniref:C2H2-type domain-containing protein n=1 Tax=Penicilliopsis zonata CBS 506.65 TaxID=1073090 RepID=A0A1L9SCU9_9EURO|nr:hypothetical protein ASPZODRAFT_27031 [Penicilliopsis zonata CBS 506.65]OJJ45001.1 hypothetical protein ASPZODRAFT_27031 [Penicilliopsis zonata CBS 506.65]
MDPLSTLFPFVTTTTTTTTASSSSPSRSRMMSSHGPTVIQELSSYLSAGSAESMHHQQQQQQQQQQQPQVPVGLGISHCRMEAVEQPQLSTQLHTYPLPRWPETGVPNESFYDPSLPPGLRAVSACYEPYGLLTPVSSSPVSLYETQPGFGPHNRMEGQCTTAWSYPTPRSSNTVPPQTIGAAIVEEPQKFAWDQTLFITAPTHVSPLLADVPLMVANPHHHHHHNTACPVFAPPLPSAPNGRQPLLELDTNTAQPVAVGHRLVGIGEMGTQQTPPRDTDNDEGGRTPVKRKRPRPDGLQCTECGFTFTRRSNCREHMKRHDPSLMTPHPCEVCGREFGRRSDLKRHVDCIHRGFKRFSCDECGRRFTRQDTLSKHQLDCSQLKVPNQIDSTDSTWAPPPDRRSPSSSPPSTPLKRRVRRRRAQGRK